MRILFKKHLFVFAILAACLFMSCSKDDNNLSETNGDLAKITVFSDPHYYDPSLGVGGAAFENYLTYDRKLIAESDAILQAMISQILSSDSKIVVIPGDLTKDGERDCHVKFASYLKQLKDAGKVVIVAPGNHDVNNPSSVKYVGDNAVSIPNITPDEFKQIYADYGYNSAFAKDSSSLSYAIEPLNGIVFIVMDACKYKNSPGATGGVMQETTLNWTLNQISAAKAKNKAVFGVIHHGILEHFSGQKIIPFSQDYVIDDWENISDKLAFAGMKTVFTGHFHANDIVKKQNGANFIFDIETGSLITAPCSYRNITLSADMNLTIETKRILNINYDTKGVPFPEYAYNKIFTGMTALAKEQLQFSPFDLDSTEAYYVAPYLAIALYSHFAGDEIISDSMSQFLAEMTNKGKTDNRYLLVGYGLQTILTDLAPKDNNLIINLNDGTCK